MRPSNPSTCAECGHLHFEGVSIVGYSECPIEGCLCAGQAWRDESNEEITSWEEMLYPLPGIPAGLFTPVERAEWKSRSHREEFCSILRDVTLAANSFGRNASYLAAVTNVDYWRVH